MPDSAAQASRKSILLEEAKLYPQSRSATVAINPPSDILSDVAAAALPAKLQNATQRLQSTGEQSAASATFAAALNTVSGTNAARATTAATLPDGETKALSAPLAQDKAKQEALKKLEAYFLQTFVDSMLPKDAEDVYGSGTAGDAWRSMLAEHVAAEMARSAKFGIAERLAGNHFSPAPLHSLTQPHTAPGENGISSVKGQGKLVGLSAIAPTTAAIVPSARS